MRKLTWSDPGEMLSADDIKAAESRLNVQFPMDYREMISSHSNGNPEECVFQYAQQGEKEYGNFGFLMSLLDWQEENVFEAIEDFGERLPNGLVPIIGTGMGDFVCLNYSSSEVPTIVYFSHETPIEDAVSPLANTFSEFLELLTVPED